MSEAIQTADPSKQQEPKAPTRRTAVLVVHGMGSQRALDTVRGVLNAVWLDKDGEPSPGDKRYWLHPERKGSDLDLSVLTTSEVPGTPDGRSVDFHELYWAHLMSETRAVAVLLWLFELVRKGPRLKPGMRALWWGATIFLCLLVQSAVLLSLHAVLLFLGNPPLIDDKVRFGVLADGHSILLVDHWYHEPEALLLAPFFVLFMAAFFAAFFSLLRGAWWLALGAAILAVISGYLFYRGINFQGLAWFTSLFLPILVSLCVAGVAMGAWGMGAMAITYILSSLFFLLYQNARWLIDWDRLNPLGDLLAHRGDANWAPFANIFDHGWMFWSLNERYSAVIAFAVIAIYLALYALFLQPFLGDAARYFRASPGNVLVRREIRKQAVEMLDTLHKWGTYDRIIVVAHSLGTVVAYDMLRAYFSRVNNALPKPALLEPEFSEIDSPDPKRPTATAEDPVKWRSAGRELIRKIAARTVNSPAEDDRKRPTWLVTDFVTLGSPLTHAHYLMCDGKTEGELVADFNRRVAQREFPTCPPSRIDGDGFLGFVNPGKGKEFHHAALFGMTRWSNLYFPMKQLFWGDAIGGPLTNVFGPYVEDVEVYIHKPPKCSFFTTFFTHTAYWSLKRPGGRRAYQILKLRKAINLVDQ